MESSQVQGYMHSEVLVKPKVLIAVSGSGGSVVADEVVEELSSAQGELFSLGHTMAHLGTDKFDLEELVRSTHDFEVLHLIADAEEHLLLDGQEIWASDFAEVIARSSCRFVLITGESGDLVVSKMHQELVAQGHDCAIMGIPRGVSVERRRAFVGGFYREFGRAVRTKSGADAADLALAGTKAMELVQ